MPAPHEYDNYNIWLKLDEILTAIGASSINLPYGASSVVAGGLPATGADTLSLQMPDLGFKYVARIECIQWVFTTDATVFSRKPLVRWGYPGTPLYFGAYSGTNAFLPASTTAQVIQLARNGDPNTYSDGTNNFTGGKLPEIEFLVDPALTRPSVVLSMTDGQAGDSWVNSAQFPAMLIFTYTRTV